MVLAGHGASNVHRYAGDRDGRIAVELIQAQLQGSRAFLCNSYEWTGQ